MTENAASGPSTTKGICKEGSSAAGEADSSKAAPSPSCSPYDAAAAADFSTLLPAEAVHAPVSFSSPLPDLVWSRSFDLGAYSLEQLLQLSLALFVEADCLGTEAEVPPQERYSVRPESMRDFLARVQAAHHPANSYHNGVHAVHVQLNMLRLLRPCLRSVPRFERLAALLAAVVHDLAHCGQPSAWCAAHGYLMNAAHAAQPELYARNALERNSVERAWELLQGQALTPANGAEEAGPSEAGPNFLHDWGFSPMLQRRFRARVQQLILGTDITDRPRHARIMRQFARVDRGLEPETSDDEDGEGEEGEEELSRAGGMNGVAVAMAAAPVQPAVSSPAASPTASAGANRKRPGEHKDAGEEKADKKAKLAQPGDSPESDSSTPSSPPASFTSFSFSSASHRRSLLRLLLLCADVGCVTELFPLVIQWADRLYEESALGHNFVRDALRRGALAHIPADAPQGKGLRVDAWEGALDVVSRYRIENDGKPEPAAAAEADSSPDAEVAEVPSACASLSSFYCSQSSFLLSYALPLYTPLAESSVAGVSDAAAEWLAQLRRNIAYLSHTDACKPRGGKMLVRARAVQQVASVDPALERECKRALQRLQSEYATVAAQHASLNAQQTGSRPRIHSLRFESNPPDEPLSLPPQPHAAHAHVVGAVCCSVSSHGASASKL